MQMEKQVFPATVHKLNESSELKRLAIEISAIIPYRTAKNGEKRFEDLGTACIQDRMVQREKELVAELVREGKLNPNNYLVKDGSLEYRPTKEDKADKRKYQILRKIMIGCLVFQKILTQKFAWILMESRILDLLQICPCTIEHLWRVLKTQIGLEIQSLQFGI